MACRLIRHQGSIRTNDGLLLNWKYWNIRQWHSDQSTTVFIQGNYFDIFISLNVVEYVRKVFGISNIGQKLREVRNVDTQFLCVLNSEHCIMICSDRVVHERHYHCGRDSNLLITTSPDNILSAGDPVEGYDLSAIAGPPTNHTITIHAMARLVSIIGMIMRWMIWWGAG